MPLDLEAEFHEKTLEVYENGKREIRYNASRFLQKIRREGGLAAAKAWLAPKKSTAKPPSGFMRLVDSSRLDISLEALVLKAPWASLFSANELDVAQKRLRKYGYFIMEIEQTTNHLPTAEEVAGETFTEGSAITIRINAYERSDKARNACVKHHGATCYICGFDFGEAYGNPFAGFIHVHHLCPLSEIGGEYQVDPVADLRPVCPNCHAIIHSRKPAYSIAMVRSFLDKNKIAPKEQK